MSTGETLSSAVLTPLQSSISSAPGSHCFHCVVCGCRSDDVIYWSVHTTIVCAPHETAADSDVTTSPVTLLDQLTRVASAATYATATVNGDNSGDSVSAYVASVRATAASAAVVENFACATCATQLHLLHEYETNAARLAAAIHQRLWYTTTATSTSGGGGDVASTTVDTRLTAVVAANPPAASVAPSDVDQSAICRQLPESASTESIDTHTDTPACSWKLEAYLNVCDAPETINGADDVVGAPYSSGAEVTTSSFESRDVNGPVCRANNSKTEVVDPVSRAGDLAAEVNDQCDGVKQPVAEEPTKPSAQLKHENITDNEAGVGKSGAGSRRVDWSEVDKHFCFNSGASDTDAKPYHCRLCSSKIKNLKEIRRHVSRHLGRVRWLQCKHCEFRCYRSSNLAKHERSHTGTRPFVCEVCGTRFCSKDTMIVHIRTHTGTRPYQCDICDKRFTQNSSLQIHKRCHVVGKGYICDFCGKRFSQLSNLKCHRRVHTGEMPYSCSVCRKTFRSDYHLKVHQIEHTGQRPYVCSVCQCGFLTAHRRNVHMGTHTGHKRAFVCGVCEKVFSSRATLRDHERLHSGEKPFSCGQCGECFHNNGALRKHRLTHQVSLQCTVCGLTVHSRALLNSHVRSAHSEDSAMRDSTP